MSTKHNALHCDTHVWQYALRRNCIKFCLSLHLKLKHVGQITVINKKILKNTQIQT